jgi:hypothetical protein
MTAAEEARWAAAYRCQSCRKRILLPWAPKPPVVIEEK